MIDRPQGVTIDDAARELRCAPRTIWRDLDALQQAGFPLYSERASDGYRGLWLVREEFRRALHAGRVGQHPGISPRCSASRFLSDIGEAGTLTRIDRGRWADTTDADSARNVLDC